ncbi:Alpha/beta hydrolase fold-3 domain protein [Segniliparus rotundus DSM 44985]|uniref:Alpha/beta hydrolase fold-3 domain protein n=1 Tax=Segniliparus rotundus (strain ATCC BAA-972 / CDC 1076 / CIP 108378 / DSM 44985 / JCM 13578) TaxID=640132 RepID=D6ZCA9_SEGRD|nr:alpha/beta hydrolase [Segniliparus rotundus]ADG99078.1 Alpha/beta hydrolase fold-3 domain protein [Segniliparus rotundus DSM 44985]
MSSEPFANERFGLPSWQAKAENMIARLVVKPVIWAAAFIAEALHEWAPAPFEKISPYPLWRRGLDVLLRAAVPIPGSVSCSRVKIRGVTAEHYTPHGAAAATVLYFHGGGFVIGSPSSHRLLATALVRESGAAVLSLDYRMPPQIPFTQIVDDGLAVYRQLLADGADPKSIVFAGDSAGGYLTVATAQAVNAAGLPSPAGLVALAPALDLRTGLAPTEWPSTEHLIPRLWIYNIVSRIVAPLGPAALTSPTDRDLAGLPPTLVQVSADEVLYPHAVRLAEALADAGVPVKLQVWDGVMHVFQLAGSLVPESRQALANIAEFIWSATGAPPVEKSAQAKTHSHA